MANRANFPSEEELKKAILQEKAKGTPDAEIGRKYGVTFKYIERLITSTQGLNVSNLNLSKRIKRLHPKDFKEEQTTVWSFKQRGDWATHSGEYRGNWSPYIPRNVILKYSKPGEIVLDYFCGAGTTAIECKLLGRRCIAMDINEKAIELAKRNLDFSLEPEQLKFFPTGGQPEVYEPELRVGDARDLSFLQDNSVDLICAHPPYANIIHYTDHKEGDLSFYDMDTFLVEMGKVARESFRVLKPNRQCAILIGDMRKNRYVVPLGFKLLDVYLDAGFKLRELVIKRQHNCKTTGFWYARSLEHNFLLLAHEYLFIFEKPSSDLLLRVKEQDMEYKAIEPVIMKPSVKEKLESFETTTVWILSRERFEECLNKNIVERYSKDGHYTTIVFDFHPIALKFSEELKGKKNLLFIKSPFLNSNPSKSMVEEYLEKVKKVVERELPNICKDGFVVLQTRDVRIDGYIEPLAKRLVDLLEFNELKLKEIVIVTPESSSTGTQSHNDYLKIVHQYLLIYEVIK
ncbi:methyltransferase domain-containing protein [bacterium]|nr:methyltransferase domain-containing protein [bacterium]